MTTIFVGTSILLLAFQSTYCSNSSSRGFYKYGMKSSQQPFESTEKIPTTPTVEKTVEEVERILKNYPELPKIDRSEILNVLKNITDEDQAKLQMELMKALENEKNKILNGPKSNNNATGSVMVVLPYKPDETQDSLDELYTRRPIVKIEQQTKVAAAKPNNVKIGETAEYSIVEKEDANFNPPLRVIGYRYHSTTNYPPLNNNETQQDDWTPTTSKWTYSDLNDTHTINATLEQENYEYPQQFHLPVNMDDFKIEDAVVGFTMDPTTTPLTSPTEKTVNATTAAITNTTESVPTVELTTPKKKKTKKTAAKKENDISALLDIIYKTTTQPTTFSTSKIDVESVKKILPHNMRNVLTDLGLDSNSDLNPTVSISKAKQNFEAPKPEIDTSSYSSFKPIPRASKRKQNAEQFFSDDMTKFLSSFGLLDDRNQKSVKTKDIQKNDTFLEKPPQVNPDILTETMKKTLASLGLFNQETKSERHVFNPSDSATLPTDEESKKLNALITTIRHLASLNDSEPITPEFQDQILQQIRDLDNITLSYEKSAAINDEIHQLVEANKFKIPIVMREHNFSSGPEPLNDEEELLELKNEVKRQENSTSDGSTTTESSPSSSEPANSPSLADSAFGGPDPGTNTSPDESASALPPKRPNGLYLLLDWNTFFEVGTEEDSRRVNIRFQPKIGDGRNFLPVTIP